jgi:hexokinase
MNFTLTVEITPATATTQSFVKVTDETGSVVADGYWPALKPGIRAMLAMHFKAMSAKVETWTPESEGDGMTIGAVLYSVFGVSSFFRATGGGADRRAYRAGQGPRKRAEFR